jgi:hypothetical protein
MKARFVFGCAFGIFACFGASAEDGWVEVGSVETTTYSIKTASYSLETNRNGEEVATVIGRSVESKSTRVEVHKWYVSSADCSRGYGSLVTLTINGDFDFDNEFVVNSGSMASLLAELICGVHGRAQSEAAGKGI